MATYFVDGNTGNDSGDGSSGRPWKTLAKANSQVQPGDEVLIRSGTYRESLTFKVRNTTWKADTGHTPVIDGRYHDGLFDSNGRLPHPEPGDNYLPNGVEGNMLLLKEEGIVVDGLRVQNCAGSGIGVTKSHCVVRNCRIDFMYGAAIKVNPGATYIDNVVLENNVCSRISMRYFDPHRGGNSPQNVAGVIKMGRTRDGIIRNNIVAYGHGEGINIGKGSYRTLVEGNIVHTCNHVHLYINRSVDVILRNNLVYHQYTDVYLGENKRPPAGIVIGDENTKTDAWPTSAGGEIYNNIVIGMGTLLMVRNSKNYNTQLNKCYIGFNTFIGGSKTESGISISGNNYGRHHRASIFENNIILNAPDIGDASGNPGTITYRNNLWSEQPAPALRGPGDRIGNPNLVELTAVIGDSYPEVNTRLDPRNYQLTARSTLAIGMASDGSAVPDFNPPVIRKDFFGANRDLSPDIGAHEYNGVPSELTANFSTGPGQLSGTVPHTVDFVDKSTSTNMIVSRLWEFGDGETSTETNPSHTYTRAGVYDVSLTVTDDKGNTDTEPQPGLISITMVPDFHIPDTFRRFVLADSTTKEILAFGTQYPDLRCILVWNAEPRHILNFSVISDVIRSSLNPDTQELMWLDGRGQDESPVGMEDEEELAEPNEIPALVRTI